MLSGKISFQKTINKEFSLEGFGLQTGKKTKMFFYPQSEDEGISLVRLDLQPPCVINLNEQFMVNSDRSSKIGSRSEMFIETTEHLLASLWGMEIDNIRIELTSSEVPAMDGSALEFIKEFEKIGLKTQVSERKFIKIKEPIWAEDRDAFLGIFPSSIFKISYLLEYPSSVIGRQFFSGEINPHVFKEKIAPARTFCLKEEAEILLGRGYGKGANFNNTLVMTENGPIQNRLRFPDEHVRHKVLDLVGDLYLLGRPIIGRIIAIRSGHKLNLELVAKIKELI